MFHETFEVKEAFFFHCCWWNFEFFFTHLQQAYQKSHKINWNQPPRHVPTQVESRRLQDFESLEGLEEARENGVNYTNKNIQGL